MGVGVKIIGSLSQSLILQIGWRHTFVFALVALCGVVAGFWLATRRLEPAVRLAAAD
jgi:hypothetical protein